MALEAGWTVWKWVLARGAGFPARTVLDLAAPDAADAADELEMFGRELSGQRDQLVGRLIDLLATVPGDRHRRIRNAIRKLERTGAVAAFQELEESVELPAELRASLHRLVELERVHAARRERFEHLFADTYERISLRLTSVAREPRFREAITWQNRAALRTALDRLAERPPGRANGSDRKRLQLVARYLQRYCLKNDSIGFFGPIGWATIAPERARTSVVPGPDLLATRTVYFEHWCIDLLAQQLAQDPELRPSLKPRQMPTTRVDGTTLHYRSERTNELAAARLPAPYARLLAACDGRRTAREIAQALLEEPLELEDEQEVFGLLAELEARRLCTWTFEIPTVTEWPERHLRALLDEAGGPAAARGLEKLDKLEHERAAVARAAGDPEALDAALTGLDAAFVELTSASATRRGGQTYAGRTLVFEDCRRDLTLELGQDLTRRLGPPLHLLLQSARWYTFRIAELYREALERAFDRARQEIGGDAPIDYQSFWPYVMGLFPADPHHAELVGRASAELQRKWSEIIQIEPGARRGEVTVSQIAAAVAQAFVAPHPGWPGARYHSPDLMIAAPSVEALCAGEGALVLGEFHPSVCTLHFVAQKEHPERSALVRARELDLARAIPMQVTSKERCSRADHMWVSRHDLDIEIGTTRSWRPREHVVAVSALVVERRDGAVVVRDRSGAHQFDLVEFYGTYLSAQLATQFPMFPPRPYSPRISIDGLVVSREQWRLSRDDLALDEPADASARFAAVRAWARARAFPRWVFVKVPGEPKPVYIDFASPIYVEMFCKLVRDAPEATVSEMLPSLDETWLPDAQHQTYTSELRILAVDPAPWQLPTQP